MKRIRLTIEWPGACSEEVWAECLRKTIENADASGLTRVSGVELITDFGDTTPRTLDPARKEHGFCRVDQLGKPY